MNEVKYVQLESAAFITDIDFQSMDALERGVYCTLIFYMYANGGKVKCQSDGSDIASLLGWYEPTMSELYKWSNLWDIVSRKFTYENGYLYHKRVTAEIERAKAIIAQKSKAGAIGAAKRWHTDSDANNTTMAALSKVNKSKVSKNKVNKFKPPTLEEIKKYIQENPELSNVDPNMFFKGFNDSGWIDTRGKPVRNWKLKLRTWSHYGGSRDKPDKVKLFPISGKTCSVRGCKMPAVYKDTGGDYDSYKCKDHLPEKVKEEYE